MLCRSRAEHRGGRQWRIEAIFDTEPDATALTRPLRAMLKRDPKLVVRACSNAAGWPKSRARCRACAPGASSCAAAMSKVQRARAVTLTIDPGPPSAPGTTNTSGCLRMLDSAGGAAGGSARLDLGCVTPCWRWRRHITGRRTCLPLTTILRR
jgi:hypothetical protein